MGKPRFERRLAENEALAVARSLRVSPRKRKIKLSVHAHRRTLRGEEVISFLQALLRRIHGPLVMVWDQHPIHRRREVKQFLAQHTRLHVYDFPTSAPELNPVEWIWQQIDDVTASTAPHNRHELRANVMAGIARIRRSSSRKWAGFAGAQLNL